MRRKQQQRSIKQERAIAEFNAAAPIGTEVLIRRDNGEVVRTRTQSEAQMLGGHTPVVWLENCVGCWMLDRVQIVADGDQLCVCGHFKRDHYEYVLNGQSQTRCRECDPHNNRSDLPSVYAMQAGSAEHLAYQLADHDFVNVMADR